MQLNKGMMIYKSINADKGMRYEFNLMISKTSKFGDLNVHLFRFSTLAASKGCLFAVGQLSILLEE